VTTTFRAADMAAAALDARPLQLPSAQPLDGAQITTRSKAFYTSVDGQIICGMWECEPGSSRWEFLDRGEFIHVLSGRMTVQRDGEDPVELTAGSSVVFPIGWTGVWQVRETLRKVFTVYRT
jgi:uncharacterized cupin superfamily protein